MAPSGPNLSPGPPDSGWKHKPYYYMGDAEEQRPDVQTGLGKPPPIFQGAGLLHSGIVSTFATPNQAQVERHSPLTLQRR